MGKGDKKTAKGKRVMGSYGVTRPKKKSTESAPVAKTEKPAAEKKEAVKKETATKKPAAKKTPDKAPQTEE